jgi:hypothetical protein
MLTRILRILPLCTVSLAIHAQDDGIAKTGEATAAKQSVPSPLGGAVPELNTQSSWAQDTRHEGAKPDKTKRGVYPVGNGRVFTYMGLGERANTMMALTGPSYAATERKLPRGHYGELTIDIAGVKLPIQRVRRVTNANFVVTSDSTPEGLALRTLTFAEPDSTTITRIVTVQNDTKKIAKGLALSVRLSGGTQSAKADHIVKQYGKGSHSSYAVIAMAKAVVKSGKLVLALEDLAPGGSYTSVLTISTSNGKAPDATEAGSIGVAPATASAKKTVAWWKKKLSPMPTLHTNHVKIMDLFRDWKVLMLTMRDAHSGVVSPMVSRRGAWIRESNGPLLTFLRYNMWDEAKALLNYFYNAVRLTGEVREYYPLDLKFDSLAGKKTDWKTIRFPESDLSSWIVLQHFWYYRSTWDAKTIKEHRPFLLACLSRQKRSKGSLMRFSGYENYMNPTLYTLDINKMLRNPRFIAEDPDNDRRSYSLASSVLFLVALQGMGDMVNGIERMENPKKWEGDPSDVPNKPSQKWLERSLPIMQDLEKQFWTAQHSFAVRDNIPDSFKVHGDDWKGFFAPAISPVTGERHAEPVANINLLPLWIGFTFPTGERSRHNLRNTLGRLWIRKDSNGKRATALVGTTSTVGHFTGDVPGMLLTALVERDGRERVQVQAEILTIAEPAGEWGQFYNPDGRPIASDDPDWPHRLSPNECGINFDATVFALNGIRHVNIANFDNRSIKLKLRLPEGTKFLEMNNLKKDNRAFNVHVDEFSAPLSPNERKQNDAQSDPKFKRDPTVDHRRFRFRMELLSDNPSTGRHQVDADVSGTMFVRYAYRGVQGGKSGIIDEQEFWKADYEQFYLDDSPTAEVKPRQLKLTPGAKLLVITNRRQCAEIFGKEGVSYIDTGLPLGGPEIARAMLKDGKPTRPQLFLDIGYNASDKRTFKAARFFKGRWEDLLAKYKAAGGVILTPEFVSKFEVKQGDSWKSVDAAHGRLELPSGKQVVRCKVVSTAARDVVLRIGSGCGYKARINGNDLAEETGARRPIRDQDATLVELSKGENTVEFELDGPGKRVLFVRITDGKGFSVPGVK